ncbi:MAG: thiamine pyrophosphate-binding protein [Candidatus Poribacteria bacterium]|nr:thiamine pyrophosphate-binding protein [Candidatus Poribacteria bacterium]
MKGADILIECLKAQGVSAIFGMPGTQNIQIYDALLRRGKGTIDHYLVRHEYAATQMADGFARATGEVGVAITVPGPGASNASTGILEAFTDCAPVLLITGQSDSSLYSKHPSKMFHGLDQMRFFESITKYCAIAHTVAEIPIVVENAFKAMRNGRPGPTMLEFPMDVVTGDADVRIPPRVERAELPPPDEADLSTAVETIRNAKMPLIFAGSAVFHSNAQNELRLLAEKLNAPVIVTRNGKGVLSEDHPLALQICYGYLGREALQSADCLIGIGPRFTSIDTRNWSLELPQPFIQIDEDADEIGLEYPCDVGVVGDLKLTLQALIEDVAPGENGWNETLAELRTAFDAQPPLPIIHELQDVLPRDTIYAIDVHALGYASFAEFPIYDPRTFLYPNIGVALGHAYPAAIGAKVAHPDRPVICFSGDGGFLMGAVEMATAMKYGINVVAIVVNDGALSAIKGSQQKGCEGRTIDTDLLNPDFVEFAQSFGAYTKRVENLGDFKDTLRDALAAEKPALIEVMLQERQDDIVNVIGWLMSEPLRKTTF